MGYDERDPRREKSSSFLLNLTHSILVLACWKEFRHKLCMVFFLGIMSISESASWQWTPAPQPRMPPWVLFQALAGAGFRYVSDVNIFERQIHTSRGNRLLLNALKNYRAISPRYPRLNTWIPNWSSWLVRSSPSSSRRAIIPKLAFGVCVILRCCYTDFSKKSVNLALNGGLAVATAPARVFVAGCCCSPCCLVGKDIISEARLSRPSKQFVVRWNKIHDITYFKFRLMYLVQ